MSTSKILKDKVAFITGSNRGIGKAITENFAANGATIWACARKETAEFKTFVKDLSDQYEVYIYTLYFDLEDEEDTKKKLSELVIRNEKIDILINNAAIAHGGFMQMTPVSKMRELFEINFFSQILVTQYIAKIMLKQKSGSIINLASIAGINGLSGNIAYGSSKAALIYATKCMAKELSSSNIRVNAIAPGLTETKMADQMEAKAKVAMIRASSMNRLAQPQEIADTALFLASHLSRFITGQVIRVDGGN